MMKRPSELQILIDEIERRVRLETLEEAARIADAFDDENLRMAGDTIMTDPVLAKARKRQLRTATESDFKVSEQRTMEGCIHSAMAEAARNIAAGIRGLAQPPQIGPKLEAERATGIVGEAGDG